MRGIRRNSEKAFTATPKDCNKSGSWINLVERWFAELTKTNRQRPTCGNDGGRCLETKIRFSTLERGLGGWLGERNAGLR